MENERGLLPPLAPPFPGLSFPGRCHGRVWPNLPVPLSRKPQGCKNIILNLPASVNTKPVPGPGPSQPLQLPNGLVYPVRHPEQNEPRQEEQGQKANGDVDGSPGKFDRRNYRGP